MAERMRRTRKAVAPLILLALAGVIAAGCGSGDDDPPEPKPPPISAATASKLATLSERIATALDAGETCDAAYAADELEDAVAGADIAATLRPGVEQVASRLVDEVNCPPPPAPEPEEKKKGKDQEKGDEGEHGDEGGGDDGGGNEQGPPHNGGVPPGQAKLKGEEG
jgi:hypothetical protein